MLTADGPRVLEFNCRFGDPETQPIMMRLRSDLVALAHAAACGRLADAALDIDPRPALCVVLAAPGYPAAPRTGGVIQGLDREDPATKVFHAGTREASGQVLASGGRVLGVTGLGTTLEEARTRVYRRLDTLTLDGGLYRRDIGRRPYGTPS